jgi:nucleoside 2-deoxyribosyltransferase
MKIYIASSWKNHHAVEMMTALLREKGHTVLSFIENNYEEGYTNDGKFSFEDWMKTSAATKSFHYDTTGASTSDIVIYISPSGQDAAAECGIAWAKGIPIIGLYAKGEGFGLMRKMMQDWCFRYTEVLDMVDAFDIAFAADKFNESLTKERKTERPLIASIAH